MFANYGKVEYSEDGKVICHICGKSFNKLLTHVWQAHGLSEKEYKLKFGLDLYKGLISENTKLKLQEAVKNNYDLVVTQNLVKNGKKSRFEKGSSGRTIDKISPQTYERLKNQWWSGKFKKKEGESNEKNKET